MDDILRILDCVVFVGHTAAYSTPSLVLDPSVYICTDYRVSMVLVYVLQEHHPVCIAIGIIFYNWY